LAKGYGVSDAAKDTGVSSKEASAAQHQARNDAFGSKESGNRSYDSKGDRTTGRDTAAAYEVGKDHGLFGNSGSKGSGKGSNGHTGGSGGGK